MVRSAGRNPVASAWRFDSSLTDHALVVQGIARAVPDCEAPVRIGPRVPWRGSRSFAQIVCIERGAKADWLWVDRTAASEQKGKRHGRASG